MNLKTRIEKLEKSFEESGTFSPDEWVKIFSCLPDSVLDSVVKYTGKTAKESIQTTLKRRSADEILRQAPEECRDALEAILEKIVGLS
jgi:hypothetical protein